MSIRLRNIDWDMTEPAESWPFEAVLAALERGGVSEWAPLIAAIRAEPWGTVAQRVEQALEIQQPYGVAPLMRRALAQAREAQRHAPPEP